MPPTTRAQAQAARYIENLRLEFDAAFASFDRFRLQGPRQGNLDPIRAATRLRQLVDAIDSFTSRYPERRIPDDIRQQVCRILLYVIRRVLEYNVDVYATAQWHPPAYVNRPEHNNLYLQLIGNPPVANRTRLFAVEGLRAVINADDVRDFEAAIEGISARLLQLRAPVAFVQVFQTIEQMADEEEDEDEDDEEEDEEEDEDEDEDEEEDDDDDETSE